VHADALLRIDGDGVLRLAVFRFLDVIAKDEAARPAVVERLRHRPWWRESWLAHLAQAAASTNGVVSADDARSIVISLGSGAGRLSEAEYLPYVEMRLARGDFLAARHDWGALASRPDAEALLRDPTFQTLGGSSPFDWRRASGVGVSSDVEATGNGGRALRVDYDGASTPDLPRQIIVLSSGRYSLAWRERITGPPRIVWRVRCLGPEPRILAQNSPVGAADWRARALTFEVTPHCPAQELELVPLPGERREDVTGWFAGLALSRRS
ncbi:MAG: hypothetical protein JO111_03695, partial [Caulobacteraceae bacterium]|nr:hypothetical protein [Caulobacteraceae bacterium]